LRLPICDIRFISRMLWLIGNRKSQVANLNSQIANRKFLVSDYQLESAAVDVLENDLRIITQVLPELGDIDIHTPGSKVIIGSPYLLQGCLAADKCIGRQG